MIRIAGGRIVSVQARKLDGTNHTGITANIRNEGPKEVKDTLELPYSYEGKYDENFAEISISGILILEGDDKSRKEVVEYWKKEKQLPSGLLEEILAAVNYTAGTVGTLMAFAINVPAPINVLRPKIMPQGSKLPGTKAG